MSIRLFAVLIPLALALPSAHAQARNTPGEYAYAVKVKMMGISMPAIKFKQCVTRQDIDQGRAYVNNDKQADCSPTGLKWSGDAFTVSGTCRNPERSMTGKGRTSDTGFELVMDVEIKGDMPMSQRQTVTATRVGDCAK